MNIEYYLIVGLIILGFLMYSVLKYISDEAEYIYKEIDKIKAIVVNSNNILELKIQRDLLLIIRKKCWHRKHFAYCENLLWYVNGKIKALEQIKNEKNRNKS